MRLTVNLFAAVATAAAFVSAISLPARAECKRYGFTVNDYGKDGPTRDAKSLLDKLIATKMTEKGVKDFHTGKKSVSCELFLNFIVFDEHTCTAEATVCWGGTPLPKTEQTAASDDAKETKTSSAEPKQHKAAKKKEAAKKSEAAAAKSKTAALRIPDPKKPAEPATTAAAQETPPTASDGVSQDSPASESPAPETAAVKSATTGAKPVETGSLSDTAKKKHHHVEEPASATGTTAAKPSNDGAGYPTPMPPQDDSSQ
jgi:hypothetical protein